MVKPGKKTVIFGTGKTLDYAEKMLHRIGFPVLYYVDNDKEKWGTFLREKLICDPKQILLDEDVFVVISSKKYSSEMLQQLMDLGIERERCILPEDLQLLLADKIKHEVVVPDNKRAGGKKILYDSQMFALQTAGGITRYFHEVIQKISEHDEVSIDFFEGIHRNRFDFSGCIPKLNRYWGRYDEDIRGNVYALNDSLLREFTKERSYSVYHPTYYDIGSVAVYDHLIITVHDMIHELFLQDDVSTIEKKKKAIMAADGIIAVSENTKKDLIELLQVKEDKIKVIYHGNSLVREVTEGRIINEKYLLYVGNRGEYKNGRALIEAFGHSRMKNELKLVFFGGEELSTAEKGLIKELDAADKVMLLRGDDKVLSNLYAYAEAFVYPSLYEGFGIPILEAMHYGCPVITANTSSIPEVGGDAVLYFDPHSVEDLRNTIDGLLMNPELRNRLSAEGRLREKLFSWEKTAEETLEFYNHFL